MWKFVLIVAFLVGAPNLQQDTADETKCENPELRRELLERVERDQSARRALIERMQKTGQDKVDPQQMQEIMKELHKVDSENRQWLKEIVDESGWPGKTKVKKDGAHAAWLLVQHADADREFQKKCLKLMEALEPGEVAPIDIAYLTDRVLVGEGKKQRYGTQAEMKDGKAVLKPVEDRENLNKRRAALKLDPIEDYLKQIEALYAGKMKSIGKPTGKKN